jgi:hypothetical protein
VYDDATGLIDYCYAENYNKNGTATEAECQEYWYDAPTMAPTPPPPSRSFQYNVGSSLTKYFSPVHSPGAYFANQSIHCFDETDGAPTYVRGLTSGYFYFEGQIDSNGLAVVVVYTNDIRYGYYPIAGSLTLNYTLDFSTVEKVAYSCQPSYLCDAWPTTLTDGMDISSTVNTVDQCLYNRTATPGNLTTILSEFSSAQGTSYMCSNPTKYHPNAVNGSWYYIPSGDECNTRPPGCPNNEGPYNNGIGELLPDGKGFVATQWNGWNFGDPEHQNGRSLFAASSETHVAGVYCVYDDATGLIDYCYAENYNKMGAATEAECQDYWYDAPTMAPTAGPEHEPPKLTTADIIGIVIGCAAFLTLITSFAVYSPHLSLCEGIFKFFHKGEQTNHLVPRNIKI